MKSYLAGNPELRIALNDDLVVGRQEGGFGRVVLDDCNFNECVDTSAFATSRVLRIKPPEGLIMDFDLVNNVFRRVYCNGISYEFRISATI